jgi:hypothetical protein
MKIIVKIGVTILLIVSILSVTSICFAYLYKNEIVNTVLARIAQNNDFSFESEETDLILFSSFPLSKLSFDNVKISSNIDTISSIKYNIFSCNILATINLPHYIFHKEIKIEQLEVKDGFMYMSPVKGNKKKKNVKPSNAESFLLKINRFSLKNFNINYEDKVSKVNNIVDIENVKLSLNKAEKFLGLNIKGNGEVKLLSEEKMNFLEAFNIDASLEKIENILNIKKGVVSISGNRFSVLGDIDLDEEKINTNLIASNLKIENFKKYVQDKTWYVNNIKNIQGRSNLKIFISGKYNNINNLKIDGDGKAKNIEIKLQKENDIIKISNMNFIFKSNQLNNYKSYIYNVKNFAASFKDFTLSGNGNITNFSNPIIKSNINFSGNTTSLNLYFITRGIVSGNISFETKDIFCIEKYSILTGEANVQGLNITIGKGKNIILDGKTHIEKNRIQPQLNILSSFGNGFFAGEIKNYTGLVKDQKEPIIISGNLNAEKIDVDAIMEMTGDENFTNKTPIVFSINGTSEELDLFKEKYYNSSAKIYYANNTTVVDKIKINGFGGSISGNIEIEKYSGNIRDLNGKLKFNNLEIDKLPYLNQFFNIKKGSIRGACSGNISMSAPLRGSNLDVNNLVAKINLSIDNGRLVKFEPIQTMSSYIRKELLEDIKFYTLQNTFTIEKGLITIPKMEVRSSALNTFISGKQKFNGDFEYKTTLFLSDFFARKPQDPSNPIKEGKTKLFLKVTSKEGKISISYDKEEWGKNFGQKIQKEVKSIKELSQGKNGVNKDNLKIDIQWEEEVIIPTEKKIEPKESKPNKKDRKEKKIPAVQVEWEDE